MKFTDSPVIELEVGTSQLSFQQDNGTMHVGTTVWSCSLILVKFMERWQSITHPNPYSSLLDFTKKHAIDIDTRCSVAAKGLYLLDLTDILLIDIAPVMPALKINLKRNKPVLEKMLKSTQLYWYNHHQINSMDLPFDIVISTDVVYIENTIEPLVSTIETLVVDTGAVLLGYQIRSSEAQTLFWEMCGNVFYIEKMPHEHLYPDYTYGEADVYIL